MNIKEKIEQHLSKSIDEVKKYNYKPSDFTIKKIGGKISHEFESKDGEILANLFWGKGNVYLRGMVGDHGTLEIKFPFANVDGIKKPSQEILLRILYSIIRKLNRGEYHE